MIEAQHRHAVRELPAYKSSFCRNSKAEPWKELVPDLVVAIIVTPLVSPYSAEYAFVRARNSLITSGFGLMGVPLQT